MMNTKNFFGSLAVAALITGAPATLTGLPIMSKKISEENFFVNLPLNKASIIKIDDRTFKVVL